MESDSDVDIKPKFEITTEETSVTTLDLLPEASKKSYERAYNVFMEWIGKQNATSFSENVLLTYFGELAAKFKSSTLWTQYSMLRTTLKIHNDVDISKYLKLRAFLKRHSIGYRPKKSKVFSSSDINRFIEEAPDEIYLVTKVALVMGVMGSCNRFELHQMKTTNFNDMGSAVLVTVPDSKNKIVRNFIITGRYYEIYKKYASLRPQHADGPWFFLNYQKGKCTIQRIGKNKLGAMGKDIAKYLKLPNYELYTGHCFRRSSATILSDGCWKIKTLPKEYNEESRKTQHDIASKIAEAIQNISDLPSTSGTDNFVTLSTSTEENNEYQENINIQHSTSTPKIIFNNCTFIFN